MQDELDQADLNAEQARFLTETSKETMQRRRFAFKFWLGPFVIFANVIDFCRHGIRKY